MMLIIPSFYFDFLFLLFLENKIFLTHDFGNAYHFPISPVFVAFSAVIKFHD